MVSVLQPCRPGSSALKPRYEGCKKYRQDRPFPLSQAEGFSPQDPSFATGSNFSPEVGTDIGDRRQEER